MKPCSRILSLFVVGWICAGCAMLTGQRPDPELAAQYVRSAQDLEHQGDQAAALEQYKLALTADPQNQTAKENSERLTRQLAQLADERYQLGIRNSTQWPPRQALRSARVRRPTMLSMCCVRGKAFQSWPSNTMVITNNFILSRNSMAWKTPLR